MTTTFSSDGFDLDAASGSEDVVLEVGGGTTKVKSDKQGAEAGDVWIDAAVANDNDAIRKSEEFKALGNDEFQRGAYLEAYDMYTEAIEACPGMTGEALLKEKQQFEEKQHALAVEQHRNFDIERRDNNNNNNNNNNKPEKDNKAKQEPQKPPPLDPYKPPMHVYGQKLAVYHSNRAAVCLHQGRFDEAIADCDAAVILNPRYTKAWMRRSNAYEKTDRPEEALKDAKMALELDPTNAATRKHVTRLQKLEDERMEQLKDETMGKLKDLGNSLLGNFGLSMDNFKTVQGPDGGYSISFDQNP